MKLFKKKLINTDCPDCDFLEKYYEMREMRWSNFISACENFDYVSVKNGCCTGYMKEDLPELETNRPKSAGEMMILVNKGTCILIPYEVVKMI